MSYVRNRQGGRESNSLRWIWNPLGPPMSLSYSPFMRLTGLEPVAFGLGIQYSSN